MAANHNSTNHLEAAKMDIKVTAKSVYGETKFYPANHSAECLARIAGTKTLTMSALENAADMGCVVMVDGTRTLRELVAHAA